MKRYGPLIAVSGVLVIGDPGRHHLRLTPDAVILRDGTQGRGVHAWDHVERVTLDVPTTRFRLPGLVSTLVLGAVTVVTADMLDVDPDDGAAELLVDGESTRVPLSRHHVGGYWAPTVDGAHRLLDHLIRTPAQRSLLARPESVIDVAAKLARSGADVGG
ncbi:hypothetical protein [Microbacterium sp. CIAB417]|uniref:hypothetical protein n=1 Tax=Microbacterium sp. CIAB417 TaxID=2860287 RepID=UPI001FABE8DE|nr:hypothetical protein [Microbacterium sp. CIAB417]